MKETDFDSTEEWHFYHWLLEAEQHGLVSEIEYHVTKFILSGRATYETEKKLKTKTKTIDKFLLHPHSYTPDFNFTVLNSSIQKLFVQLNTMPYGFVVADVKGGFSGKYNNSAVTFPLNQKWVYDKWGYYVQKVIPEKLFKKTWVPEVARLTPKKKQPVKKYIGVKTIKEFLS